VRVHVASADTKWATELCIRSMYRYAGAAFELVVGDGGSLDGSLKMLRRLERRGLLQLEVPSWWRQHYEWLDHWCAECPTRYAVFSDSDVQFRAQGWLGDMIRVAEEQNAALVCAHFTPARDGYVHPGTGQKVRLAARPAIWLLLVDLEQIKPLGTGFAPALVEDDTVPEGRVAYDTGARLFVALEQAGLHWVEMPSEWVQHKAHHFGGLSWLRWSPQLKDLRKRLQLVRIRARVVGYRFRYPLATARPLTPAPRGAP
jgi:hypothetical protein